MSLRLKPGTLGQVYAVCCSVCSVTLVLNAVTHQGAADELDRPLSAWAKTSAGYAHAECLKPVGTPFGPAQPAPSPAPPPNAIP